MKIRTAAHPIRRALWRFDNLCARQQWVPLAIIFALAVLIMIIQGVAP